MNGVSLFFRTLRGINVPKGKVWANFGLPMSFKCFLKFSAKLVFVYIVFIIYIKNQIQKVSYRDGFK